MTQRAAAPSQDDRVVDVLARLGDAGRAPRGPRWAELGCVVVPVGTGPLRDADRSGSARYAVVLDGIVLQRTRLRDRIAAEVLAEGDVIDLQGEGEPSAVEAVIEHVVHRAGTVALVGDDTTPALQRVLHRQLAQQCRRASTHLAILHLPRIEDRIVAVFLELAERHGRMTRDGVVLDLALTHALIGCLVAGRRPTVSLALTELAEAGRIVRRDDGTWLLARAASSDPRQASHADAAGPREG